MTTMAGPTTYTIPVEILVLFALNAVLAGLLVLELRKLYARQGGV